MTDYTMLYDDVEQDDIEGDISELDGLYTQSLRGHDQPDDELPEYPEEQPLNFD